VAFLLRVGVRRVARNQNRTFEDIGHAVYARLRGLVLRSKAQIELATARAQ